MESPGTASPGFPAQSPPVATGGLCAFVPRRPGGTIPTFPGVRPDAPGVRSTHMAHTTDTRTDAVHIEDVAGVRSRVSWGALLGGAVIAIAAAMVFTFLFAAIGVSLRDADVRGENIGIAAIIAAIATLAVSLFLGGW